MRTTRIRRTAALTPIVGLALALAACGQTTSTADGDAEEGGGSAPSSASSSAAEGCEDVATSEGPVSLTDSYGNQVELEQPAERVAVLEWQQTEDLLSLCVTPVAVADVEGYNTWVSSEELPTEGVEDVGTRGEPNLEALFATEPDLVVVEAYTPDDEILTQLAEYGVPVLATKGADAADPIANMKDTFELIAQATGREERAQEVLDEFDATLAEGREALAGTDAEGTEFVYFDGYIDGANVVLRPFGQGSLMGELGEELGLVNAWDGEVDPAYGLGSSDIEGMSAVGDATFFYTGTVDPAGDVMAELETNPVWSSIPAVEDGRSYAFPEGVWTFGGPASAGQAVEAYVDLMTQQ